MDQSTNGLETTTNGTYLPTVGENRFARFEQAERLGADIARLEAAAKAIKDKLREKLKQRNALLAEPTQAGFFIEVAAYKESGTREEGVLLHERVDVTRARAGKKEPHQLEEHSQNTDTHLVLDVLSATPITIGDVKKALAAAHINIDQKRVGKALKSLADGGFAVITGERRATKYARRPAEAQESVSPIRAITFAKESP